MHLELYDETCSFMRPKIEQFRDTIISSLENKGLNISCAPICRRHEEFTDAVLTFEKEKVCAIITLHLAYSPSLESIEALSETNIPLVIFDTTMNNSFSENTDSSEILYNHGIHGVQDLCNMLKRRKKHYKVFAGHFEQSDVLDRLASYCRGLEMAAVFQESRVGLIGDPFKGMGDFYVPFDQLKSRFNIDVIQYDFFTGSKSFDSITEHEIDHEKNTDLNDFVWDKSVTPKMYEDTTRVCLALRKWQKINDLTAFTINFMETEGSNPGLPIMPFTECSKAMQRGIGYAGEGDILTAALCGCLLQVFPETTFTEMFCPDWHGNSIFLSHMGEINYRICRSKPVLTEKDFPFTSAENPTVAYATYMPGKAVMVNIAPGPDNEYSLILIPGEMRDVTVGDNLRDSINGWFMPYKSLSETLEQFSFNGGTHHSVLVYGDCIEELCAFASALNINCVII